MAKTGFTSDLGSYLSKRHALMSFEITGEPMSDAAKDMSDATFAKEVIKIQDKVGFELAESARKTMSKWLDPSNPRRIGLTGEASRNLFTKKVSAGAQFGGGTQTVWYVYEGNQTKANRFIRRGTKANPSKSSRARANAGASRSKSAKTRMDMGVTSNGSTYVEGPLIARLSAWAKARGLKPKIEPPRLHRKVYAGRGIGPGPATQVNIPQSLWKQQRSMVWALYHSILQHGSFQSYKERFGTPFYDYVKVYMSGKGGNNGGTAKQIIQQKMSRQGEAYRNLSYITTRFVYSKLYKSGMARGRWSARNYSPLTT